MLRENDEVVPVRENSMGDDFCWVGPFRLWDLLGNCMNDSQPWPPDGNGVYVVSERPWSGAPTRTAGILYVGGNSSHSPLFAVRVGSLIADMLGFFTNDFGHHSGGQHLWQYCHANRCPPRHPLDLYLGWVENVACPRCAEMAVFCALQPSLCRKVPPACQTHAGGSDP
jgi:hypothetical protein